MERLVIADAEIHIDVDEPSGIVELPITGFTIHPRLDSIRIVGFISRGSGINRRREATVILHVPMSGFVKSLARTLAIWRGEGGVQ